MPTIKLIGSETPHWWNLHTPMPVTFHRAFDKVPKLGEALEDVIQTGAARILTSGGQPQAVQALPDLAQLVQAAQRRISLMAVRWNSSTEHS